MTSAQRNANVSIADLTSSQAGVPAVVLTIVGSVYLVDVAYFVVYKGSESVLFLILQLHIA